MGRACSTYGETWVNLNERDYLENLNLDGKIILKWIFKKYDVGLTGLIWLREGTVGGVL
jgi:hypothetical protein